MIIQTISALQIDAVHGRYQTGDRWLSKFAHCDVIGEMQNGVESNDPACNAFYVSKFDIRVKNRSFYGYSDFGLQEFLSRHNFAEVEDVERFRLLSATSYAFCDRAVNKLREMVKNCKKDQCLNSIRWQIQRIRCARTDISNVGPTITIFFGLFILGIGRTMPFSLGLPLIGSHI